MALSSAKRSEFSHLTRQTTWESLSRREKPFDVLIVGGGIVGAGVLRELALRGLTNVLLVEKNDFASGTSGASSKLIHAGIRYLEQSWNRLKEGNLPAAIRDFRFVLQASRERKTLRNLAPHLVASKTIHFVLGDDDERSPLSVLAGTWAYYLMQAVQGQGFGRPRAFFHRKAIQAEAPLLDAKRVRAMFTFSDSETDDARLVIENLQDANDRGAAAMNYVELVSFEKKDGGVSAVLKDRESGETVTVSARVLINATGAFVDDVAARGPAAPAAPLVDRVAGSHIDVYPALTPQSFYVTAGDGRLVFVLCRHEDGVSFSRIGTTERPLAAGESSEAPQPSGDELRYLISLANTFFPATPITAANIIGTDAGIRPLRSRGGEGNAFQKSREHDIVAAGSVYHVVGVKLTDYRRVAEEVVGTIRWENHGVARPGQAAPTPLRSADRGTAMYPEIGAAGIVAQTMALHWDDVALRRLGARPRVMRQSDPAALDVFFAEVADALQWPSDRRAAERQRFLPPVLP